MLFLSFLAATAAPMLPIAPGGSVGAALAPFVVPAGTTQIYDTDLQGTLLASDVILETDSTLEVRGSAPLLIVAEGRITLDGWILANGRPGLSPLPVGLGVISSVDPWPGAPPQAGGGAGGSSSETEFASTPKGGDAPGVGGGRGAASGYTPSNPAQLQLGGSGGGGRFAADEFLADPELQASAGVNGAPIANSAITGLLSPEGGSPGNSPFVDGNPDNDFFGYGLDSSTGLPILGELKAPRGGFGGGAGGDAILSDTFPQIPWMVDQEWQGAPGGGGGGLVAIFARELVVGPQGGVAADGGFGGSGEYNPSSLRTLGGSGGGGSGGMLLIQAGSVDLTAAPQDCFRALGGSGGLSDLFETSPITAGGNGGDGLIQLHVGSADDVKVPQGQSLADFSAPDAKRLLPFPLN